MKKWVRLVAARLPWLTFGVAAGAASVWVARDPVTPVAPVPSASVPAQPDPDRDRRVGAALALVRPGMTRREAEAVLGPPDLVRPQQITTRWRVGPDGRQESVGMAYVVYYCSPPDQPPGQHLMTVTYDATAPIPLEAKVFEVGGPHVPDD